ncbi:MAG TPA: dynamin family protein [Ignavibacteriales bacterium]|nr:dynamin family protein [Ignavibacteriales bacterium]
MISKEILNDYLQRVDELHNIMSSYELSTEQIEKIKCDINDFMVVTPLVGGFSSGKSSLINAIIEEKILPTKITPETSIPTEIVYNRINKAYILQNNEWKETTFEKVLSNELKFEDTKLIKLELNKPFMEKISTIKLVDMPGLDSGIEAHNQAIDNYLNNSIAYIITVDAEQGLTESVINFLKELSLYNVPVLVVVTKCDKRKPSDIEAIVDNVKDKIQNFIKLTNFQITTASVKNKDFNELKSFILSLQAKSEDLFRDKFKVLINQQITQVENYLLTRLKNTDLSIEDIEEKEKLLIQQLQKLDETLQNEKNKIIKDIPRYLDIVRAKVSSALHRSADSLAATAANNGDISSSVNTIVRNELANVVSENINPFVKKYINNIARSIEETVTVDVNLNMDLVNQKDTNTGNTFSNLVNTLIPLILPKVPLPWKILLSAFSIVANLLGMGSGGSDNRRQLALQKVRTEVIPDVTEKVASSFEGALQSFIDEIINKIDNMIQNEKELKLKALEDLKKQKQQAKEEYENTVQKLNDDIKKLNQIKFGS